MAALWVLFAHLWGLQYSVHRGLLGAATNWLAYPHLAVNIFIVLSGYCLVLPFSRGGDLRVQPVDFFRRRARRILPPLFAALLVSALFAVSVQMLGKHGRAPLSLGALLANVFLLQDVLPQYNTINAVFWSVALECKIYLFFPLLFWILRTFGGFATVFAGALIGFGLTAVALPFVSVTSLYHTCPWYLMLFASGIFAGHLRFSDRFRFSVPAAIVLGIVGLAGLLGMIWRFPITASGDLVYAAHLPVSDAFCGIATAAGLYLLGRGGGPVRFLLERRPLVFVGRISYSLYLIHLPVLFSVRLAVSRMTHLQPGSPAMLVAIALVGLPMVAVCSYCFFVLVEAPFLSRRAKKAIHVDATPASAGTPAASDRVPIPSAQVSA